MEEAAPITVKVSFSAFITRKDGTIEEIPGEAEVTPEFLSLYHEEQMEALTSFVVSNEG